MATAGRCRITATELGTLEDLCQTVHETRPTGIHFSGHGMPGGLLFENDEGREHRVSVNEVIEHLRGRLPDGRRLPPFFYLASCHGNEPVGPAEDAPGSPSAAVQLHRSGVTEVVGYFGPIADELSTRAEEAIYEAIAEGLPTRDAVRQARRALARPFHGPGVPHRPGSTRSGAGATEEREAAVDTHPFAWAQLVLYRRGPEWPLSTAAPRAVRRIARVLERSFQGFGERRVLSTGFVGRRSDQHRLRRLLRAGERVLVLQGLGGLGKSTLAQQVLPWLTKDAASVCTLWCREVEGETNRAEALVAQLLAYCRQRFGLAWEGVVQQVDQAAGDDSAKRFVLFLQALVRNAPGLVLYLDNLESLLVGPEESRDPEAFGRWAEPALEAIWRNADDMARGSGALYLVASCRYRNEAFAQALVPVGPLPPDALFRLMEWFPALQRLSIPARARLVSLLDGHPRAVEFANDLVADALAHRRDAERERSMPALPERADLEREWEQLVAPCLPRVEEKLADDLLLQALWERVLDDRTRRFLYRMTVLRRPAEWKLLALLGETEEPEARALETAERLRDTSLLERVEWLVRTGEDRVEHATLYALHPATERFVLRTHADAPDVLLETHRRLGERLEEEASRAPYLETAMEGGHHLFEAGELDRACELLGGASNWLQDHGRAREGLRVLEPFQEEHVHRRMDPGRLGAVLGTIGAAYAALGETRKAIGFYEQHLVIAREIGDRQGEGNALGNLGSAYAAVGEVRKAIEFHGQALVISREIGDRRGEGSDLRSLGNAYADLGEVREAIGFLDQALASDREIGDRPGESSDLGILGTCYFRLGEVGKAIGFHEQALGIRREIGDRRGESSSLGSLGTCYLRLGEVGKALRFHEQALVICRETADRRHESSELGSLGNCYLELGEVRKALGFYEQARVIQSETEDRRGEGNTLGNIGSCYFRLGEVQKAIGFYEQALVLHRETGDRRPEGNALGNLGTAYAAMHEVPRAIESYEQALVIHREIGDRRGEGTTLGNLGIAYADLDEVTKAIGLLNAAVAIGQEIGDPQIVETAAKKLKELLDSGD